MAILENNVVDQRIQVIEIPHSAQDICSVHALQPNPIDSSILQ